MTSDRARRRNRHCIVCKRDILDNRYAYVMVGGRTHFSHAGGRCERNLRVKAEALTRRPKHNV